MSRFIVFILFSIMIPFANAQKVSFYSDILSFSHSCAKVPMFSGKTEEKKAILSYYEELKECGFLKDVSVQLETNKKEYHLSDFYMAQILENLCLLIAPKVSNKQQKVLMYCVLSYMGYDVRLAYSGSNYFVLALGDTKLFNHSYLEFKNKKYYSVHKSGYKGGFSNSIDYVNNDKSKVFTYSITEVPILKNPHYQNKKIVFYKTNLTYYDEKSESYLSGKIKKIVVDTTYHDFVFNKSLIDLYRELPMGENDKYFHLSLSDSVYKQIFRYLTLSGLETKQDTLKYLIAFVRSIGEYKTDMEAYNREVPMFPEEALYYKYTDCEDRNALLFYLIKEVLNLPMVILEYPSHINIAVAIDGNYRQFVKHKKHVYYVCEASSGGAVIEIGESNAFDSYSNPIIIGEYNPN